MAKWVASQFLVIVIGHKGKRRIKQQAEKKGERRNSRGNGPAGYRAQGDCWEFLWQQGRIGKS